MVAAAEPVRQKEATSSRAAQFGPGIAPVTCVGSSHSIGKSVAVVSCPRVHTRPPLVVGAGFEFELD